MVRVFKSFLNSADFASFIMLINTKVPRAEMRVKGIMPKIDRVAWGPGALVGVVPKGYKKSRAMMILFSRFLIFL